MRILLTGVDGMLGSAVKKYLTGQGIEVLGVSRSGGGNSVMDEVKMDLVDWESYTLLDEYREDVNVVIHCAANTDVNACEQNRELTYRLHVEATARISQIFNQAKFVYISSDSVYGDGGDFDEDAVPNPLNYYSTTKLYGESMVVQYNQNPYIIRTNIYGYKMPFGRSLFEWAYTNLRAGMSIDGYTNVFFNPLSVNQLSEVLYFIVRDKLPSGIYNAGITEYLSKYTFLQRIRDIFGFDGEVREARMRAGGGAPRPLNTTMNTGKISKYIDMSRYSNEDGLISLAKALNDEKDQNR